jgi:serine/threonine-protein kinase
MMLTPAGAVKLMDFGIAKGAGDHKLTMTGTTLGSLYYMSPEQIQGAVNLDARSDLYSVGVSLYELVTGKRPFDGDSQFAIMSAHLKNTPVPPIAIDPSLPQALNDIILLSVAKDPDARFQGAAAFRNALSSMMPTGAPAPAQAPVAAAAGFAAASPASAMPTEVLPQTPHIIQPTAPPRPRGSHRGLWMALGGIATAAVVIGAIELGPWKGTKAAQPPQQQAAPVSVQTPTPAPAASQPAATPEPAAQTAAPAAAPPVTQPAAQPPAQQASGSGKRVRSPMASAQTSSAVSMQPTTPLPQPTAEPTMASAPAQQPAAQPPQPSGPSPEEMEKAHDKYDMLQARATAIRNHSLFRAQAASGLGIRSDAATAKNLMDTYMRNAADALNSGNPASAQNYMSRAERQIEILEKILN